MDVTPVIGTLAIVGLVALFVAAIGGLLALVKLTSSKPGDPFFEDDRDDCDAAM